MGLIDLYRKQIMRLAAVPFLLTFCLSPLVQAATLSVCTEASPEGFDVVQYN